MLGPTYPNRLYTMSATLDPNGENGGPLVQTTEITDPRIGGKFTWTTMPEQLKSAGITWKVYNGQAAGVEDNTLALFKSFTTDPELKKLGLETTYEGSFKKDLHKGELPQVSWVNFGLPQTEHPGNSTTKIGERYVWELIHDVKARKEVWEKTAIFITWDENGGFFDHVVPPTPPLGTPDEYLTAPDVTENSGGVTGPIGLGFRVPMLVVSPYSRGGLVSSEVYDHTSILRFLETRFGVEVPNLSAWRRETTGDLTGAFNFAAPPTYKMPGKLKVPPLLPSEEVQTATSCTTKAPVTVPPNSVPVQESGTRGTPSGIV